jgi:hypothetical protein
VKQPTQPVLRLAALTDQRLAMVRQQAQITGCLIRCSRREIRMGNRSPCDRERVDAVGLPEGPTALSRSCHQLRRNANDSLSVPQKKLLQPAAHTPQVFKSPEALTAGRYGPDQQLLIAGGPCHDGELAEELTTPRHHAHRGVGLLVRVDPDNQLRDFPFVHSWTEAELQRTSLNRGSSHAPLRSRRRSSNGDGRQNQCWSALTGDSGTTGQSTAGPRT